MAPVTKFSPASISSDGVQFNVIDADVKAVATALQPFLESGSKPQTFSETGSKFTGVSVDDISTSVTKVPSDITKITAPDLMELGMKLFDALVWLQAGKPLSHPLQEDKSLVEEGIPSRNEIRGAVFYVYYFLLTLARYPRGAGDDQALRVPNYLKFFMGMTEDPEVYVKRICSFGLQKLDPSWIKYMDFNGFKQECVSRFGLGVAGYRLFGPFKLYAPRDGLPKNLRDAFEFAKSVATAAPTWDIHSLTRKPSVLAKRGNLDKNLGNLILDVFTESQIQEMVDSRVLYRIPNREPTHRNYLSWSKEDDISGTDKIFPN